MAAFGDFQNLVLKGVAKLNRKELGRGAYGRVYAVQYCGTICAAKEIHQILIEEVGDLEIQRTVESFMRECHQCSILRHPNVIQFLGVYYPSLGTGGIQRRMQLPVMVMEMMADNLTSLVDKHEKIPTPIKYSIAYDVSLGLCYLHNHDPPIIHRDLSPNNVLLTTHHVAKISDLGVAKVIKADSRKTMTKVPGTVDFMPPESLDETPVYGPPMDVFSFAGIVLHTFNQQWPRPSKQVQFDPISRKRLALSEVERRQQYLDKMIGEAKPLRPLVEECLDDDPAVRPTITAVCEMIQVSKDLHMKERSPQDIITLHKQVQQLRSESEQKERVLADLIDQLKSKIGRLQIENQTLKQSSTRSMPTSPETSQLIKGTPTSKLKLEAPPLIPALTRYHLKWTQLANLPVPMYSACVTVQDKKVYVAGGVCPVADAVHQVYLYDVNTDQWDQLPPSGHKYGVICVIGTRLAVIGGRLSTTNERTNKVSTFDETSQTWTSYFPDLLSVRNRPGVVTHLEHVIVAGGTSGKGKTPVAQDDIEVLNWIENSQWRKVPIILPGLMDGLIPIISDDHLLIVGYNNADGSRNKSAYKIPVDCITRSGQSSDTSTKWITMTSATHWSTALVPSSSPPVVVGGQNQSGTTTTSDIKMYDDSSKSWKKISSLSSARSEVAIAAVNNNAIIAIGGYTKGWSVDNAMSSCLTTVELGQAQLTK